MRLGIGLPHQRADGTSFTTAEIMARARSIEAAGFDGIWVPDSIGRLSTPRPDPLMWLLLAGAATMHIELGTAVLQVPLRGTVELAQRLLTLHAVTGGRFVAGLGAGSTQADFDAVGADYPGRFRALREALPRMRRLFHGETVDAASLHPWPGTGGGPPIVIGSWESGPWVIRAATEYDGWMASAGKTTFTALAEGIQRYRDAGGKRAMVGTLDVDLTAPTTSLGDDERFTLRCGPQAAAERLQRLAELGYDDALLRPRVPRERELPLSHSEGDPSEAELKTLRALVERAATGVAAAAGTVVQTDRGG
jgi:alkanesulfonate monooxygenase SsuD/methylene tetrahydromethanopterin reductase-like flavin-dependent oxidoreductase (luciferase family)